MGILILGLIPIVFVYLLLFNFGALMKIIGALIGLGLVAISGYATLFGLMALVA